MSVKSPSEFIELATAQARKQFDVVSAQNKELWALTQKVTTETAEPIKTGIAKNLRQGRQIPGRLMKLKYRHE